MRRLRATKAIVVVNVARRASGKERASMSIGRKRRRGLKNSFSMME